MPAGYLAFDPFAFPLEGGTRVVEASAGTGKTYGITFLHLRLLLELEVPVDRIAVVTFTNAATADLRQSVRARLREARRALDGAEVEDENVARYIEALGDGQRARGRQALRAALGDYDQAAIFSIHGFAQRMLRDNAFESGAPFELELLEDERPLIRQITADYWARETYRARPELVACLAAGGVDVDRLTALVAQHALRPDVEFLFGDTAGAADLAGWTDDPELASRAIRGFEQGLIQFARGELLRRKRARRLQSFNDQLHDLERALRPSPAGDRLAGAIRARFDAALIDEFQDTNPVQHAIFQRIFAEAGKPLVLIGDPKQSIYAFRGGDIFTYLRAAREAGPERFTLDVNWRSDDRLVRAVDLLFKRLDDPFLGEGAFGYRGIEARPRAREKDVLEIGGRPVPALELLLDDRPGGDDDYYGRVAADVARLLSAGARVRPLAGEADEGASPREITAGDVAILVTANRQSLPLQTALRARGIPAVISSDQSVFESTEAEDLWRLLDAVAHPSDASRVRTALATELIGLTAADIFGLDDDEQAFEGWLQRVREWRELLDRRGVTALLSAVLDAKPALGRPSARSRLLALFDGERRMTNLAHLGELLHGAAVARHLGAAGLRRWLELQRGAGGEAVAREDAQLRLESDDLALKIVTVHKAKGLQYPVVYLPFMHGLGPRRAGKAAVLFHDPAAEGAPRYDLGTTELERHRQLADRERVQENMRVLYVALTRAEHLCKVVWRPPRKIGANPLGVLLHHPDRGVDDQDASRHMDALTADQIRADLERLAERSDGAIGAGLLGDADASVDPIAVRAPLLEARTLSRPIPRLLGFTSFSDLVSVEEQTPFALRAVDRTVEPERAPGGAGFESPLGLLPAGRIFGSMFHEVLERVDFAPANRPAVEQVVRVALTRYGLDASTWCEAVGRVVDASLDTEIVPDQELALARIDGERALREVRFDLPIRPPSVIGAPAVDSAAVAELFARYATAPEVASYAQRLRGLGFQAVAGFLRGAIDLAFEHRGRWHIVDYKTNHLGHRHEHYSPALLAAEMDRHHYYLQYHLYAVALHRYLGLRVAGYDYDRHFGGAHYLFVRGMRPDLGAGRGVFSDRPPSELIRGLDRLLDGAGGEA
jgi:exodeoxyribonuclease V beta subunit